PHLVAERVGGDVLRPGEPVRVPLELSPPVPVEVLDRLSESFAAEEHVPEQSQDEEVRQQQRQSAGEDEEDEQEWSVHRQRLPHIREEGLQTLMRVAVASPYRPEDSLKPGFTVRNPE